MGWEHTDNMGVSTFRSNAPAHDLNIHFNKSPVAVCTFLTLCNIYIDKSLTNTYWKWHVLGQTTVCHHKDDYRDHIATVLIFSFWFVGTQQHYTDDFCIGIIWDSM